MDCVPRRFTVGHSVYMDNGKALLDVAMPGVLLEGLCVDVPSVTLTLNGVVRASAQDSGEYMDLVLPHVEEPYDTVMLAQYTAHGYTRTVNSVYLPSIDWAMYLDPSRVARPYIQTTQANAINASGPVRVELHCIEVVWRVNGLRVFDTDSALQEQRRRALYGDEQVVRVDDALYHLPNPD